MARKVGKEDYNSRNWKELIPELEKGLLAVKRDLAAERRHSNELASVLGVCAKFVRFAARDLAERVLYKHIRRRNAKR